MSNEPEQDRQEDVQETVPVESEEDRPQDFQDTVPLESEAVSPQAPQEPGQDESQPPEEEEKPAAEPKKRFLTPSRIVFLIFVAAAAVVIVLELRARLPYESSVKAVQQAWDEAKETGSLFRNELSGLLSGSPHREYDEEEGKEVIAWDGLLRSYRIRLQYGRGGFVNNYETEVTWRWEE